MRATPNTQHVYGWSHESTGQPEIPATSNRQRLSEIERARILHLAFKIKFNHGRIDFELIVFRNLKNKLD